MNRESRSQQSNQYSGMTPGLEQQPDGLTEMENHVRRAPATSHCGSGSRFAAPLIQHISILTNRKTAAVYQRSPNDLEKETRHDAGDLSAVNEILVQRFRSTDVEI